MPDAARRSAARSLIRLWPFVRPARTRVGLACLLAVLAACLPLAMPVVLKWMVDGPVADGDLVGVWLGGGVLLLLGAAEAALFGVRRWLTARPMARVEATMRETLYRHLQCLPIAFHDRWSSGQLLSRSTTDLQLLQGFMVGPLTFLVVNAVTILVGCMILLAQHWLLGLILLAPVPPLLVLCSLLEVRYAIASRHAQDQAGDLTTVVAESILGIRVIKGLGHHRRLARDYRERALRLRGTELRKARLLAILSALLTTVPEAAIGAALVLGVAEVARGTLSAGTLLAFLTVALELRPAVASTGSLLALSGEAATAADRYLEVLDEPVPVESPPVEAPRHAGRVWSRRTPDGLTFDGVEFRYPDAEPDEVALLRGIDLRVAAGETVALVGATGTGKSTLATVVPRLIEPTAGRILLHGRDIASLTRAELRQQVAVAFEEPTLFSTTVAENVLMGAESATEADLERALTIAQADGFVRRLPHGALTQVGEQGLTLSGGQRQRIALARAVIGHPRLLVLDDPLSALDIHTEALVEAALRRVLATTTALIVAHRPSTVLLADRVALLSAGRIAAVGTHAELMAASTEYAYLMTTMDADLPPAVVDAGGP